MTEPPIVDDAAERLEAQAAVADVLVPIDAAAERPLRIVDVECLQPIEADEPAELPEGRRVAFGRAEVVARCEQVAGVEAHADARVVVHLRDDRSELLEGRAERGSLS